LSREREHEMPVMIDMLIRNDVQYSPRLTDVCNLEFAVEI